VPKKSDPPERVPAYIALATGPGTLARAVEMQFAAQQEEDLESYVDEAPRPSAAYLRVLEELRQYVTEDIADAALEASLRAADVTPEHATSFDLREALGDILPRLLGGLLSPDAREEVVERLHLALTDVNQPIRARTDDT
jgi:hypothetical protein